MTRNELRQIAVRLVYSGEFIENDTEEVLSDFFGDEHYLTLSQEDELYSVKPNNYEIEFIKKLLNEIKGNLPFIDEKISRYSDSRRIERISKTALAVLRCAVCEMLYFSDIPVSVSINEAVEIAKVFDTKDTVSFINGILGSISRESDSVELKNSPEAE